MIDLDRKPYSTDRRERNNAFAGSDLPAAFPDAIQGHRSLYAQSRESDSYVGNPSFPTEDGNGGSRFLRRMAVRLEEKIVLVRISEVFWIQSKGNLLCLHLGDTDYDCRMTMKDLCTMLDPAQFIRIHRNAIVNLDHVVEFDLPRHGNAFVHLRNGKVLPISRTGRAALRSDILCRFRGVKNACSLRKACCDDLIHS